MIFPKNIIGPKFDEGDLLVFSFDGSDLTLRLPRIPANKHNKDQVSSTKDFSIANMIEWSEDDQGNLCRQLVSQRWSLEDARSLDNIALSKLSISLVDVGAKIIDHASLLDFPAFEKVVLDGLIHAFADAQPELQASPEENRFFAEKIIREDVNWIRVKISYDSTQAPSPIAFIPLTHSFFVMVSLKIQSLHYAGRSNPYSEETLKQFEKDLFDDFLNHIKIEYSPETIALINALNNKTPA